MQEVDENKLRSTTFQLSRRLHTELRIMCVLTEKNMGEFIRMAISEKIQDLKRQNNV